MDAREEVIEGCDAVLDEGVCSCLCSGITLGGRASLVVDTCDAGVGGGPETEEEEGRSDVLVADAEV